VDGWGDGKDGMMRQGKVERSVVGCVVGVVEENYRKAGVCDDICRVQQGVIRRTGNGVAIKDPVHHSKRR
jgi:hypothetical protein